MHACTQGARSQNSASALTVYPVLLELSACIMSHTFALFFFFSSLSLYFCLPLRQIRFFIIFCNEKVMSRRDRASAVRPVLRLPFMPSSARCISYARLFLAVSLIGYWIPPCTHTAVQHTGSFGSHQYSTCFSLLLAPSRHSLCISFCLFFSYYLQ